MSVRVCTVCGKAMPHDWGKPYCLHCGGRVVWSRTADDVDGMAYWDGTEDLSSWEKKRFSPSKKLSGHDVSSWYVGIGTSARVMLASVSPLALFFGGVATLGITSAVWIVRRVLILSAFVRDDERLRIVWFYLWLLSHASAIALLAAHAAGAAPSGACLHLGVFYTLLALFMGRYYLFWIRGALAGATMITDERADRFDASARNPLLLWYLGPAYLQFCINRATRRGVLDRVRFDDEEDDSPKRRG